VSNFKSEGQDWGCGSKDAEFNPPEKEQSPVKSSVLIKIWGILSCRDV
jgi:hypothetical protein